MATRNRKPTTALGVIVIIGSVLVLAAAIAGTLAQLGAL